MKVSRDFANITIADFIVRSAYQMGKTPLLPIFAASLGASDALLGFVVSISTLTGMVFKPLVGMLSDRWGRRWWLIAGTAFFASVPFFYGFVHTPEQLSFIRIIHGMATAIYGPVTLAFVAEHSRQRRAEKLGVFTMARSAGYVVGPAAAGWLLLVVDPVHVFTLIGLFSLVAFVPVLYLSDAKASRPQPARLSIVRQIGAALQAGSRTRSVWLSGGLEATVFIATYAAKTFLPIYALSLGVSVAVVGTFFALQEAVHMALKPLGGRIGDRLGYMAAICLGMSCIGLALSLLPGSRSTLALLGLATLMGAAQALIFPSTVALVSVEIDEQHMGTGMGIVGTLRNAGKVTGPILGGLIIGWLDFGPMFRLMGMLLVLWAALIWSWDQRQRRRRATAVSVPSGD